MRTKKIVGQFTASFRRRAAVLVAVLAMLLPSATEAQVPRLWGDLRPGPYAVGYRSSRVFDESRTFGSDTGTAIRDGGLAPRRLINVRVWYPVIAAAGLAPMTLREYGEIRDADGPVTAAIRERAESDLNGIWSDLCTCRTPRALADGRLDALLSTTVAAVHGAAPAAGRHPVIVYSLGHDMHAIENVVLWEYLASNGYVVAVTPSVGHRSVAMEPVGPTSAEVKTRDMEFVLQWLRSFSAADLNRVGAVGFSLGGWSALMLGMRTADVDVVIGLDASFNLPNRITAVRSMPFFRPSTFTLPLLNLRQDEPDVDTSVIESFVNAERYDTKIGDLDPPNASHHSFTSIYTFSAEFFPSDGSPEERANLLYNRNVFELVASRVRTFLDAFLMDNGDARVELQRPPKAAGVPEAMIGHRYLPASPR